MKSPRSRRVQAQRKFAQGAYVPPNTVTVAAVSENRRDVAQDARNVTVHKMSASGILDVISMQGIASPVSESEMLLGSMEPTKYGFMNSFLVGSKSPTTDEGRRQIIEYFDLASGIETLSDVKPPANPNDVGASANPIAVGSPANPNAVGSRANPNAVGSRANPNAVGSRANPNAVGSRANPNAVGSRANPSAVGSPANPNAVGSPAKKHHDLKESIVIVERLHGDASSLDPAKPRTSLRQMAQHSDNQRPNAQRLDTQPSQNLQNMAKHKLGRSQIHKKKNEYKRVHEMCLRSRRVDYKKLETSGKTPRNAAVKRKVQIQSEKQPKTKKKCVEPSESSVDDNRPLTYFLNNSTPKRPTAVVQQLETPAEPVAGPSGLQRNEGERSGSYYNSESNIRKWMNHSIAGSSNGNTGSQYGIIEKICVASKWRSVQDVTNSSQEQLDSRCHKCSSCLRIAKLVKLSSLLRTQTKFDLTGGDPLPQEGTENDASNEDNCLYLELLPKYSNIMMKLEFHMVLGKQILSACLIPRCDGRPNKEEFLLEEHEHLLDQLIQTYMRNQDGDRRLSISSISNQSEDSDWHIPDPEKEEKKNAKRQKLAAAQARLKDASEMQAHIKAEKDAEVSRIEAEKEAEVSRIQAEKQAEVSRIEAERRVELLRLEEMRRAELACLEAEVRARLRAEVEAEVRMIVEVDQQAKALESESDAKSLATSRSRDSGASGSGVKKSGNGKMFEAPVYRPTEAEFNDPIIYFEKIWPEALKFGICKIVPPPGWKPTKNIMDNLRFNVSNQFVSRLFHRWGPATREYSAIKLCLLMQKIHFSRAPLLEGVEVNLPKLYHAVQRNGGLEAVINSNRWDSVAEELKFTLTPSTERRLDQLYVKYLLPYDTLDIHERQNIVRNVENAWFRKHQKNIDRSLNPLQYQQRMLGLCSESEDESEDENTALALKDTEDCVTSGATMNCAKFKKIASVVYENMISNRFEGDERPSLADIENQYWNHVVFGSEHVCVHTAAIDTGKEGHGFTKDKNDPYSRHPWNLKMFSENPRNMLRYLGPVLGLTVPTLHLGMVYSTSCWHKDPHWLPWLEYGHKGPSRIWYGIPSDQANNFKKAVETLCPVFSQNKGLWLSSDIAMVPPAVLRQHDVTLTRTTQEEGEFILAFPNAYTSCISTGYTESESVYFAPPSWLENLPLIFKQARESGEPTMFSMDELIYLMAKDQQLETPLLKLVQQIYDKMLRDEVNNRQMLQERGLKFMRETTSSSWRTRNVTWNVRDQDDCEYCRVTLFLSKVKGLCSKNSTLCLEHALLLLDTEKYTNMDVSQLEVYVYVSVRELNAVGDDMKRRLSKRAS